MPFDENEPYARSVDADISKLRPLGDFVLVRPFSIDEQLAMEARMIAPSPICMTSDGRYLANRPRGLRYGTVAAMGAGDRIVQVKCAGCQRTTPRLVMHQEARKWRCAECGHHDMESTGILGRAGMGCAVGDVVIFPRIPANEVKLNGEQYILAHEEQHILGVVESEAA